MFKSKYYILFQYGIYHEKMSLVLTIIGKAVAKFQHLQCFFFIYFNFIIQVRELKLVYRDC